MTKYIVFLDCFKIFCFDKKIYIYIFFDIYTVIKIFFDQKLVVKHESHFSTEKKTWSELKHTLEHVMGLKNGKSCIIWTKSFVQII